MKAIIEEYGGIALGSAAAALLVGLVTMLLTEGKLLDAIRGFSQCIC